jgi:hypothetical protein
MKEIKFSYLPTAEMPADVLMKGLLRPAHWKLMRKLGMEGGSHWENKSIVSVRGGVVG